MPSSCRRRLQIRGGICDCAVSSWFTATPERTDGGEAARKIVGKTVYRLEAQEIAGEYLADYTVERIEVDLTDEERDDYQKERANLHQFPTPK